MDKDMDEIEPKEFCRKCVLNRPAVFQDAVVKFHLGQKSALQDAIALRAADAARLIAARREGRGRGRASGSSPTDVALLTLTHRPEVTPTLETTT